MTLNRYRIIALAAIIIVAVAAAVFLVTSSEPEVPLAGTSWRLVSIDGVDPNTPDVTLSFFDGRYEGLGPCNVYGGNYTQNGRDLFIKYGYVTEAGCDDFGALERALFQALDGEVAYEIVDGQLVLNGVGHVLIYEPAETP